MEREGPVREEPHLEAPISTHTAYSINATLSTSARIYIRENDLLGSLPDTTTTTVHIESRNEVRCPHASQDHTKLTFKGRPAAQSSKKCTQDSSMSRHGPTRPKKEPQQYQLLSTESPADQARSMSQNNKDQLIDSLRTHRVNTVTELRRIEKIFAYLDSEEVTEPMTSAWAHYVNSNNLLNELRGLTKRIPFSSECLDEAKALVVSDPASARSWNFCWLVLVKMEKESLILKHARALASKRSTWGDRQPTGDDAKKFINAAVAEWTSAVRQLLRHWDTAPSTTGS